MSRTPPRVLVAEDEAPQREALLALLARLWPEARLSAAEDGLDALEQLAAQPVDLAFLDIRMPGASGLIVAERVLEAGGDVVFTTAYDAHAVQAFEQGAIDYLLKPLQEDRVAQAIARWRGRRAGSPSPARAGIDVVALAAALRGIDPPRLRWISASLGDVVRVIAIDDVQAFHAEDKMTRVLTAQGDALIRPPLRELLPQLDPDAFWQVHRSLIVRIGAIDRVYRDELGRGVLRLSGRDEGFSVSQAAMPRFRGL
jgi:DNA-binding LytR/AlgR family response regulator